MNRTHMRLYRLISRAVILATATIGLMLPTMSPARAAGAWNITLSVHQNGGADATVTDTLNPSVSYLVTLTGTGGGMCSLLGGTGEVADAGAGTNGASVQGTCNLYNATVEYVMTWTAVGGGAGQVPVTCVWALGRTPTCTPKSFSGHILSGVID